MDSVTQSRTPKDLASAVHLELLQRGASPPRLEVLVELFDAMYYASLKTEESRPVLFHIVYVDPKNPDPSPPDSLVHDRWRCVSFSPRIPLNSSKFLKIAPASDPRTSSFAVYHDESAGLRVWGLIDQGNTYHNYVNYDSETEPERPGLFQASVTGIGHLEAYIGYEKIAELKHNALVRSAIDVFEAGSVRLALDNGIKVYLNSLKTGWPDEFRDESDWRPGAISNWIAAIKRLLLRVQGIRHGGAFLMTADDSNNGLLVKHAMNYDRLRTALQRQTLATAQQAIAGSTIFEEYMDQDLEEMPVWLHVDEAVAGYDLEEIRNELGGVIWFISLLTRVDGLVLLNQNLEVQGFGVEITESEEPTLIYSASDSYASEWLLNRVDYQHYGTRHRSMMRYCAKYPGSIGFVISQDGDVRVMTTVGGKLVLWENIQLRLPKFVRSRRSRRGRKWRRQRRRQGNIGNLGTDGTLS